MVRRFGLASSDSSGLAAESDSGVCRVFGSGGSSHVDQDTFSSGSWGGFQDVIGGGSVRGTPAVTSSGNRRYDEFAVGGDNSAYHAFYTPTTGWTGWEPLGGSFM